jgi:CrcB protein
MWKPIPTISLGAALDALLRWRPGFEFDSFLPALPLATLAASLIGGCIVGLAIAYFAQVPNIAP